MPPAALTLLSHILNVTSCFLASSETAPVRPSGAPILMSAAWAAGASSAPIATPAASVSARGNFEGNDGIKASGLNAFGQIRRRTVELGEAQPLEFPLAPGRACNMLAHAIEPRR